MNILITGGLGYLGGRIAVYLKKKYPDSNIILSARDAKQSIPAWAEQFKIVKMDILSDDDINSCLNQGPIDVILHLAAMNEINCLQNPVLAIDVNTKGTFRLLKLAQKKKISKFVYFSTFHVYGKFHSRSISEKTPTWPYHPYAITKRAGEDIANYFNHYFGTQTLILRPSNGYGYPMSEQIDRWNLIFNDFCKQIINTGKIILKSSGKQYRDFIAISDIASAVDHFLFKKSADWGDGIFNVGGENTMTILEVAQKIAEIYKNKYSKKHVEIITNPNNSEIILLEPFTFNINKLKDSGFALKNKMDMEIEKTLELCEKLPNK